MNNEQIAARHVEAMAFNPHKDMLCVISMDGETEVAKWMHKGTHVFTVRTDKAGNTKYQAAVDA